MKRAVAAGRGQGHRGVQAVSDGDLARSRPAEACTRGPAGDGDGETACARWLRTDRIGSIPHVAESAPRSRRRSRQVDAEAAARVERDGDAPSARPTGASRGPFRLCREKTRAAGVAPPRGKRSSRARQSGESRRRAEHAGTRTRSDASAPVATWRRRRRHGTRPPIVAGLRGIRRGGSAGAARRSGARAMVVPRAGKLREEADAFARPRACSTVLQRGASRSTSGAPAPIRQGATPPGPSGEPRLPRGTAVRTLPEPSRHVREHPVALDAARARVSFEDWLDAPSSLATSPRSSTALRTASASRRVARAGPPTLGWASSGRAAPRRGGSSARNPAARAPTAERVGRRERRAAAAAGRTLDRRVAHREPRYLGRLRGVRVGSDGLER